MAKLKKLSLLECETNIVYEMNVTPEIHARASMDMVFATKLLERRVYEGRTVFEDPLESFDFGENAKEYEFSSDAGPSPAETSSHRTPSASKPTRKKSSAQDDSDLKADAEIKSPPSKPQKTLKDYCDQLVEDRKKREEGRQQHHQEKIAAMNRLTDVVTQLITQTRKD